MVFLRINFLSWARQLDNNWCWFDFFPYSFMIFKYGIKVDDTGCCNNSFRYSFLAFLFGVLVSRKFFSSSRWTTFYSWFSFILIRILSFFNCFCFVLYFTVAIVCRLATGRRKMFFLFLSVAFVNLTLLTYNQFAMLELSMAVHILHWFWMCRPIDGVRVSRPSFILSIVPTWAILI